MDAEFEKRRPSKFLDLSLDVAGCDSVQQSLERYVAEEMLDGDNMYRAGDHGKQRARRSTRIRRLPEMLQLHLKRFAFPVTGMTARMGAEHGAAVVSHLS